MNAAEPVSGLEAAPGRLGRPRDLGLTPLRHHPNTREVLEVIEQARVRRLPAERFAGVGTPGGFDRLRRSGRADITTIAATALAALSISTATSRGGGAGVRAPTGARLHDVARSPGPARHPQKTGRRRGPGGRSSVEWRERLPSAGSGQNAPAPFGVPRPVGPSQPARAVHHWLGEQLPLLPDVTSKRSPGSPYGIALA